MVNRVDSRALTVFLTEIGADHPGDHDVLERYLRRRARRAVMARRKAIDCVARALLTRRTLDAADLRRLLGPRMESLC
jgi:hypothetical protein